MNSQRHTRALKPTPAPYVFTDAHQLRFTHLLTSELLKLTSLRITFIALAAIIFAGVSVSLLFAYTMESAGLPAAFSVDFVLDGLTVGTLVFGQLIAGILGVITICAEYTSGTIQSTLIASPRRLNVIAAKALVVFALVTGTGIITVFGSWAASYPLYAEIGLQASLFTPGFAVALLGLAAYLGFCALVGLGFGMILRSVASGSVVVFCATLLVPILTSVLPSSPFVSHMRLMLLSRAGDAMATVGEPEGPFADVSVQYLSPYGGWVVAMAWVIVTLCAGAIVLRRRDA